MSTDVSAKERVVSLLREEWSSISELLERLPDESWERPALPGWDVHDVVAHIVGGERMLTGAERPERSPESESAPHVHNEIALLNEDWVVALRARSHRELLGDFQSVTAVRLEALDQMTPADFDAPSWTPVGQGTYGRFMQIRVFDAWMHEQDIRVATETPGHETGAPAEQSLTEVVGSLGYIVGKRAGAPDGSSVAIRLTGPIERYLMVKVDGRARVVDALEEPPTASISLSSSLFMRLAGGRVDPESVMSQIGLEGDAKLARQLATHLGYTI